MYATKQFAKLAGPICRMNAFKTQNMRLMNSTVLKSNIMFPMQNVRSFASFDTIEKAGTKLNKALEGEVKYENENYTQLEDIETFLNESGFNFKENEFAIKMSLTK
jgi:hypothetical protein